MSFSRAPLKRFNEHVGCAPPPGTYELKADEVKGAASFHKAERFRAHKLGPLVNNDVSMSPVRRTMSVDGLAHSSKKDKSHFQVEMKQQKLLEKEIRSLVQQRGEQDFRLQTLEEELKKLEAKLLAAVREKTGLAANVASLERQLSELKKTNEFLKTKVSADTTKKKIHSLSMELMEVRNKLDAKDKELSFLRLSTEGQVKVFESDLEASRASLNVIKGRNKDLEVLHEETKAHNEALEKEMDKLHTVIQQMREDLKMLQSYLDTANEEIQDLKGQLQSKSVMERRVSDSEEKLCEVEQTLEQHMVQLQESRSVLQEKEQELQDCHSALGQRQKELQDHRRELEVSRTMQKELEEKIVHGTQELKDSQSIVKQQEQELARVREVLRRTEEELDQRVVHMNERCLSMEDERARTQEEGLRRVQELLAELSSLEESRKCEEEARDKLKQQHAALAKQLEEEKAGNESLSSMMASLREDQEKEKQQLEMELEQVLDEVNVLEKQDMLLQETVHLLTAEKVAVEAELKSTRANLERNQAETMSLEGIHQETVKKLQDEHNSSLGKMGDMAAELESTTQALRAQRAQDETRVRELNEALSRTARQLQDEQNKLLDQQHVQEKEKEEYARMLLEVQSKLAQCEQDLKQAKEEVEHQQEENQQALDQLKHWRESAESKVLEAGLQVQVEKLRQEKEHFCQQMAQEKEQLQQQMEQALNKLKKRLTEAQASPPNDDTEHWRNLYEKLYAKVKPFQEQLDGFAAERDALLSEKGATQAELNKLAGAYANLLGHQNQRQKIKHMVKLKEENLALKQEVAKLRTQVGKQKWELDQLKSSQAPRRFDPSKAFKHEHKENQQPVVSLR